MPMRMSYDGDVAEVTLPSLTTFRVRVGPDEDGDDVVRRIVETVETLMIDAADERFRALGRDDRDAIVEIYSEVG